MIASVVVTLEDDAERLPSTLTAIALRNEIEVGEFQSSARRIPMLIEATSRSHMEDATDWLRSQEGIALVDVVYVHFEPSDGDGMAESPTTEDSFQERAS